MKYQVTLVLDTARNKNFYYSYVESDDTSLGNMECEELPPYQDINKARSCRWNGVKWLYDEEKYNEIVEKIAANKQAAQEEADRLAAIPNNETLNEMVLTCMDAVNEIATYIETVVNPLAKLADIITGGDE